MTIKNKKRFRRSFLGLFFLSLLALFLEFTSFSDLMERGSLDFRYKNMNREASPSDKIVLIDIDEQTLKVFSQDFGRWPWPRRVYKDLLAFLMIGEPKIILFDILFTEPQKGTDDDLNFGQATADAGMISHAIQFLPDSSLEEVDHVPIEKKILPKYTLSFKNPPPKNFHLPLLFNDYSLPIEPLLQNSAALHVVNVSKDNDGILRRVPLVHKYDDVWLPAFSLRALFSLLNKPEVSLKPGQVEIYDQGKKVWEIPLDKNNFYPLHFYPDKNRPETVRMGVVLDSARKIQSGEAAADASDLGFNPFSLKDKIVLIGTSATGTEDLKATPISDNYPGILLHTTAISNILNHDFLKTFPKIWAYLEAFLLALLIYISVLFLKSLTFRIFIPIGLIGFHIFVCLLLFKYHSININLTYPLAFSIIALLDSYAYMTFVEGRDKKKVTGTLSKYLSPSVTQHLIESGIDPSAEVGHRKELTILFSDIRGFTTMSERLSPEKVVSLLNTYLAKMTDLVFKNNGTLDKFIGDAVMAFWGAPIEDPHHCRRAIETALEMIKELDKLNLEWAKTGDGPLHIGIGINTGDVIVGNIGSDKRLDYTVIGDNVNLASRLEGLSKYYGVKIVVGEKTYELVKNDFLFRTLDLVKVKGKDIAVRISEPLCLTVNDPSYKNYSDFVYKFETAWALYYKGQFSEALEKFLELKVWSQVQDLPTDLYIERCKELITSPPENWDGSYLAKSK